MSVNLAYRPAAFSLKVNDANIYINFDITKFFCHFLKNNLSLHKTNIGNYGRT